MQHQVLSKNLQNLSATQKYSEGYKAVFFSFTFAFKNKKILSLSFIPSLIHIIGYFIALRFIYTGMLELMEMVQQLFAGKDILVAVREVFSAHFMKDVSSWFFYLMLKIVPTVIIAYALASPFLDLLSEKVESVLLGADNEIPVNISKMVKNFARELLFTILFTTIYISASLSLFLLGAIPFIGGVIGFILSHIFTFIYASLEIQNIPMARHELSIIERFRSLKDHFSIHMGFGMLASFLMMVPGMIPFVTIGGTKLFLQLAVHDCIPHALEKHHCHPQVLKTETLSL